MHKVTITIGAGQARSIVRLVNELGTIDAMSAVQYLINADWNYNAAYAAAYRDTVTE